jgi:hypothetical protein
LTAFFVPSKLDDFADVDVGASPATGSYFIHGAGGQWVDKNPNNVRKGNVLNVMDYGAVADGLGANPTDNTNQFQNALNDAGNLPGATVYIPYGQFRLFGPIVMPAGVQLVGYREYRTWKVNAGILGPLNDPQFRHGTVLIQDYGAGQPNAQPFISYNSNSRIAGFSIWQPQDPSVSPPVAYPWAIASYVFVAQNQDYDVSIVTIENIELINTYQGIFALGGDHIIRNINGTPPFIGIRATQNADFMDINNCNFSINYFNNSSANVAWMAANGTAYLLERLDGVRAYNCFAEQYSICFHMQPDQQTWFTDPNKWSTGKMVNCAAEGGTAVLFDATLGWEFTNCDFDSIANVTPLVFNSGFGNAAGPSFALFNQCAFHNSPNVATIATGSAGLVSFQGCTFQDRGASRTIVCNGGDLMVEGCSFAENFGGGTQQGIDINSGTSKATILGNHFVGASSNINNSIGASALISGNH